MVKRSLVFAAIALGLIAASGCQDLLGLTAGAPDDSGATTTTSHTGGSTGGSGGSAGTGAQGGVTSSGGSTSTGGQAGGTPCGPSCQSTPCKEALCNKGVCEYKMLPAGLLVGDVTAGDCKANICDGEGAVLANGPYDLDFDDANGCTFDACGAGIVGHAPKANGTPCEGGACYEGQCLPAACVKDGSQDKGESGVDCGALCPPCANGNTCYRNEDCESAFCSSGVCRSKIALSVSVTASGADDFITYGIFDPLTNPPWTVLITAQNLAALGGAAAVFDDRGEGVAVIRQSPNGSTSQWARWTTSGGWVPKQGWNLLNMGASGGSWTPTLAPAGGGEALLVVQNSNLQYFSATANDVAPSAFAEISAASSPYSGVLVTRQGFVSLFYPKGTSRLVERRFLNKQWTPEVPVVEGDFSEAQPQATPLPGIGTLLVALRRMDSGAHSFDWILLPDSGSPALTGPVGAPDIDKTLPPIRKFSLARRAKGGAILVYRKQPTMAATPSSLDVWVAEISAGGAPGWTQALGANTPVGTGIAGVEPAAATGIGGGDAELLFIANGSAVARHFRLAQNGTWSVNEGVLSNAKTTLALVTP